MEFICKKIANGEDVKLEDMIWAQKLAKSNKSAEAMLRMSRRKSSNPDAPEGGLDDFMNRMDLGDPDPSNHKKGFQNVDEIVDWFHQEKSDDWRQRD
jgi:hypothetical protein|tara:strand:+ start:1128 stop:1418 length:291 start_codon:yes stop_codon:yes gene_type:complete